MVSVTIDKVSTIKGDLLPVKVTAPQGANYCQLQIEIFDVGVRNPSSRLGFGTTPRRIGKETSEVDIDTKHLEPGLYEIKLVILHGANDSSLPSRIDFYPIKDFERKIFEIIPAYQVPRTEAEILRDVEKQESELEKSFLVPVDIRSNKKSDANNYCVFVFVKNLLIGARMRFEHFEVLPAGSGLDTKDHVDLVNDFLHKNTNTGISFNYDEMLRNQSRQCNPVCVVHFPAIISSNSDEVRDYCVEKANMLLLALSLARDAGGMIFDIVVFDRNTPQAQKFSIADHYVGNLLTGSLSGESSLSIETYFAGLLTSPFNTFLVGLFKEARREKSPDFQYVRYWQILETLAESRNYNPNEPLLDYDGNVMMNGEHVRYTKGAANIVFNLLRETGLGNTDNTWKNVNIWYAFRNAVAHHGSISRFTELSRSSVRKWAKIGFEDIQSEGGHDRFLWEIKEDTKLILMRRLVASKK